MQPVALGMMYWPLGVEPPESETVNFPLVLLAITLLSGSRMGDLPVSWFWRLTISRAKPVSQVVVAIEEMFFALAAIRVRGSCWGMPRKLPCWLMFSWKIVSELSASVKNKSGFWLKPTTSDG